jgi:hypothetical protein
MTRFARALISAATISKAKARTGTAVTSSGEAKRRTDMNSKGIARIRKEVSRKGKGGCIWHTQLRIMLKTMSLRT